MYCLRVFIVVLQELHCLRHHFLFWSSLKSVYIPCFILIGCVGELQGCLGYLIESGTLSTN